MILSGRRSAGAEESIEVLLANRRRGRPNEASRLHGALIVVLFAFPAIEVRVHPARRGVAHPRRVLVAEDGVREEGGGDGTEEMLAGFDRRCVRPAMLVLRESGR